MVAPATQLYRNTLTETLADLRALISRNPEVVFSEPEKLSKTLDAPILEIEAAIEWLVEDGLEIRP